jgi:hypothetical protein
LLYAEKASPSAGAFSFSALHDFALDYAGMKKQKPISFTSTYHQSSEGGMNYVLVPAEIRQQFYTKGPARVVATIGSLEPFQCGLMPMRTGEGFLIVNNERQKKLNLSEGDEVVVSITADTSEYGAPMPEELEAILEQDPEAKAIFDGLTAGKKRAVMYAVNRAKGVEARIEIAVKALTDPRTGHARW